MTVNGFSCAPTIHQRRLLDRRRSGDAGRVLGCRSCWSRALGVGSRLIGPRTHGLGQMMFQSNRASDLIARARVPLLLFARVMVAGCASLALVGQSGLASAARVRECRQLTVRSLRLVIGQTWLLSHESSESLREQRRTEVKSLVLIATQLRQ